MTRRKWITEMILYSMIIIILRLINFSNPKINELLDTFYSTPFFWMPYIDFCFGAFTMHFDETDKEKKEK